jgi:hypothetical protein
MSWLILGLLLTGCSSSQSSPQTPSKPAEAPQPGTKLEAFLGKRGRLVVKDFYELGQISSMGKVQMDGLVIYEPGASQKIKGLRVEVTESGSLERQNISFIDLDELQSLSDAISYISDLSKKWAGQVHEPYTEITYVSKGEFSLGFYQKGVQTSAFVSSGSIGKASAYLKTADLDRLREMVDQAVVLLNSK